jgi:hypothetical protein
MQINPFRCVLKLVTNDTTILADANIGKIPTFVRILHQAKYSQNE